MTAFTPSPESPARRLRRLDEQRLAAHEEYAKLDAALANGTITRSQYSFYIEKRFGGKLEPELSKEFEAQRQALRGELQGARSAPQQNTVMIAMLLVALLVSMSSLLVFYDGAPVGYVSLGATREVVMAGGIVLNQSAIVHLNVTNTTTFRITGSLSNGAADVYLVEEERSLLVYRGDAAAAGPAVRTDKESYAQGEQVAVSVLPEGAAASLWLTDETGAKTPVEDGFAVPPPGSYTLDALINASGNLTKESVAFLSRADDDPAKDVVRQAEAKILTFTGACDETCVLVPSGQSISLDVRLLDGALLRIDSITITQPQSNTPPLSIAPVPDVVLAQGETATLDLDTYFDDADGDAITYDYMSVQNAQLSVADGLLTIEGSVPGAVQSVVYASDLFAIAQSNLFTITVLPAPANATNATQDANVSNATVDENVPDVNSSTNVTLENVTADAIEPIVTETTNNTANVSADAVPDCTGTNPNELPVECLYRDASEYFPDEEILLLTLDRTPVGRFTQIGNLLLRGGVVQFSTRQPGSRDYRIGYADRDGVSVTSIWIDSATGDLHLRGALHEENANLAPPRGSYSLSNKRSIFLAYADPYAGDLYVRGNVIPYRPSIGVS